MRVFVIKSSLIKCFVDQISLTIEYILPPTTKTAPLHLEISQNRTQADKDFTYVEDFSTAFYFWGWTKKTVKKLKKAFEDLGLCESNKKKLTSENLFETFDNLYSNYGFCEFAKLVWRFPPWKRPTYMVSLHPSLQPCPLMLTLHHSFFHPTSCLLGTTPRCPLARASQVP